MSAYDRSGLLFCDLDLRGNLEVQRKTIDSEVRAMDPHRLLNTAVDDLVQYFVDKNHVEAPVFHRDQMTMDSKEESEVRDDYGHRITRQVQRLYFHVPFDGEAVLFKAQASTYSSAPPRGHINEHSLIVTITPSPGAEPEAIKATIQRELDEIDRHLEWIRNDVAEHNRALRPIAERAIQQRRAQVLQQQGLVAALGIPLRERTDSPGTYVVPTVRKKIVPVLPPASAMPYKPEPALSMDVYEHILGIVQSMTQVMERSPRTFAEMDEEALRDQYLVQLNGHYQGSATGETFNASGKTDILIREHDKNIFIAECKFWKGPAGYTDTIDQLLGYTSWRDTKTAIVIFNRNRDTSRVIEEIRATTQTHQHCKRTMPWRHESGLRFVMRHPSDANRELTLSVLVFDIPEKAPRASSRKKASSKT